MSLQTPWNSAYNNAKGALLVGNATRPIVRTVGTNGQVLTANSANADGVEWATPSADVSSIVQQTFAANGTYTPTAGMNYCIIEVYGGGGGAAGPVATGAGQFSVSGGAGAGGYSKGVFSAAAVGVSQAVVIGAGGAGGLGGVGTTGGTSSVGALISATGGQSGAAVGATASVFGRGGAGGTGSIGGVTTRGSGGDTGLGNSTFTAAGWGGSSAVGQGGEGSAFVAHQAGTPATGRGAGGGGSTNGPGQIVLVGAAGSAGLVIITEYI